MNLYRKVRGFTLIELLVVMSIITMLITMSAFGLRQARESARDGQRKADLETIRTGLAFYKADCNEYPISAGADFKTTFGSSFVGVAADCGGSSSTYISKTPSDPVTDRNYWYNSNGLTYIICMALESETTSDSTCAAVPTANCGTASDGSPAVCSYSGINP